MTVGSNTLNKGKIETDEAKKEIKSGFSELRTSSLSSGELDLIIDKKEWEKAIYPITKDYIMNKIPDHCKVQEIHKSVMFLSRDILFSYLWYMLFVHWLSIVYEFTGIYYAGNFFEKNIFLGGLVTTCISYAYWTFYVWWQGVIWIGLWVLGHECGHGAFAQSQNVNDFFGFFIHSFLLVPYFSWQYSHGKHHKFTNHMTWGETHVPATKPYHQFFGNLRETIGHDAFAWFDVILHLLGAWPMYIFTNLSGGRFNWVGERLSKKGAVSHFMLVPPSSKKDKKSDRAETGGHEVYPPNWHFRVQLSTYGVIAMSLLIVYGYYTMGNNWMTKHWLGPYIVTNGWLVGYTWLHHTDTDIPWFGEDSFTWLRGALCTIDRPYPWIYDELHHHIGSTHVLHHLNFKVPHYHAVEATECIKPCLIEKNLYRTDNRNPWLAMKEACKLCEYTLGIYPGLNWFAYDPPSY